MLCPPALSQIEREGPIFFDVTHVGDAKLMSSQTKDAVYVLIATELFVTNLEKAKCEFPAKPGYASAAK